MCPFLPVVCDGVGWEVGGEVEGRGGGWMMGWGMDRRPSVRKYWPMFTCSEEKCTKVELMPCVLR